MGSNTRNAYELKAGANKLEEINIAFELVEEIINTVGSIGSKESELSKNYAVTPYGDNVYNPVLDITTTDFSSLHWSVESQSSATQSELSSVQSQLKSWEAEAAKMTANSYAVEAHDVFIKEYTSVGDGTFTSVNTTDYSAEHWAIESLLNSGINPLEYARLDGATFTGQAKGITPVAVDDFATKAYTDSADLAFIKKDGTVPMDAGYAPAVAKDVSTKEYVDGVVYGWVSKFTDVGSEVSWPITSGDGKYMISVVEAVGSAYPGFTWVGVVEHKSGVHIIDGLTTTGGPDKILTVVTEATTTPLLKVVVEIVVVSTGVDSSEQSYVREVWKWEKL